MYQKIKAFFYHFGQRKIYFLPLITAIILFFPKITFAWSPWDAVVNAITFIPMSLLIIATQAIIAITSGLAGLASRILEWVLSPNFISLSYTNPGGSNPNTIIEIGLNITQSFVNMALVLILVFIAFATILRLKEYQTQKLLITLIVVALLVNFAPVICGLIIDPCNILMHYFTDHVTGFATVANISSGYMSRMSTILNPDQGFTEQMSALVESFSLIIFNLMLFFALLIFSMIFAVRYAVIWVLVILSPLAFVSYILPSTKKIWNQWWTQFINWSIVGITGGFFIYLAEQVMEKASAKELMVQTPESESLGEGIANVPLQFMIPLIFMYLGLLFTFQTSAMGSSQILAFAKKGGQKARGWAAKGGKKTISGTFIGAEQGVRGAYRGIKEGKGLKGKAWKGVKEAAKGTGRGFAGLEDSGTVDSAKEAKGKAVGWAKKKLGIHETGKGNLEKKGKIDEAQKRINTLSTEQQTKIAEDRPINEQGKIEQKGAINALAEKGKLSNKTVEEIKKLKDKGKDKGLNKESILMAKPSLAPYLTDKKRTVEMQFKIMSVGKKPSKKIEKIQPEEFENLDTIKSLKKNILNVITSAVGENSQEVRDSLKKYVVNNMSLIIAEEARLQKQNTRESKEQLRNINDVIQEVKMM